MWIFDALLFGICLPFQCFTEVVCSIPLEYPEVLPSVFARCQFMSRISQKEFNECLLNYMRTLEEGDLCMSSVLMWIQENAEEWIDENKKDEDASTSSFTKTKCKYSGLSRLWIYSHHIYRKELLKKIPESAKELDLTGFCLPGKPGIICAEGYKENCDEYWQRLKYPNWKHISCKHREDLPLQESDIEDQLVQFRLFNEFEVLAFEAHGDYGLRNDYHMDLGQFREYLSQYGCEGMFQIFFGLDTKSSNNR